MPNILRNTPESFCEFAHLMNEEYNLDNRKLLKQIVETFKTKGYMQSFNIQSLNDYIGFKHPVDYLRASNVNVRNQFFTSIQESLLKFYRSEIQKPDTIFYQVSIICETMSVDYLSPEFNIPKVRERIRGPFRKYNLEGLGMIEFDIIRNYTEEKKRVFSYHFHGLLRSNKRLDTKKLKSSISRFRSDISPISIDIKPLSFGETDFLRAQSYFVKPVRYAKLRSKESNKLAKVKLKRCERLRILETNSLMTVTDLLIGFGEDGNRMKREISKSMTEWSRENGGVGIRYCFQNDTKKVWRRVRKGLGLSHYDDVNITRRR